MRTMDAAIVAITTSMIQKTSFRPALKKKRLIIEANEPIARLLMRVSALTESSNIPAVGYCQIIWA